MRIVHCISNVVADENRRRINRINHLSTKTDSDIEKQPERRGRIQFHQISCSKQTTATIQPYSFHRINTADTTAETSQFEFGINHRASEYINKQNTTEYGSCLQTEKAPTTKVLNSFGSTHDVDEFRRNVIKRYEAIDQTLQKLTKLYVRITQNGHQGINNHAHCLDRVLLHEFVYQYRHSNTAQNYCGTNCHFYSKNGTKQKRSECKNNIK